MDNQYIEILGQNESFDSPVDRYYRGKKVHRGSDEGPYNVKKIFEDNQEFLIRSRQDYTVSPSGQSRHLSWSNMLFDFGNGIFWKITARTNSFSYDYVEQTYTVITFAPTPEEAGAEIKKIYETYRAGSSSAEGPCFFMLRDAHSRALAVSVDKKYGLSDDQLVLHYGNEFLSWSENFKEKIEEPGITILRGAPGTGKTSYLRHLICKHWETHRFYYVPVESFGLLSSSNLPEFWQREERLFSSAVKVLVLEDAETLLMDRESGNFTGVSSLLNLTDGFIGDLVQVHIVCTLNTEMKNIDQAILRPGRQKSSREFDKLSFDEAVKLAESLGTELTEEKSYTLAEVYHAADIQSGNLSVPEDRNQIGFKNCI